MAHGGSEYYRLRASGVKEIHDFSIQVNPYPLPFSVSRLIDRKALQHYPLSVQDDLRNAMSKRENCASENILPVAGASEGLRLIAAAFCKPETPVITLEPAYSGYRNACGPYTQKMLQIDADKAFSHSPADVVARMENHPGALVFVCTPCNPTGVFWKDGDLRTLENAAARTGGILVVDESYARLCGLKNGFTPETSSALVIKSVTKEYGIPGLRLGMIKAAGDLIGQLSVFLPDWSIDVPAQLIGLECFRQDLKFEKSLSVIARDASHAKRKLSGLGHQIVETPAPFFMLKVKNKNRILEELKKDHVIVRDCTSFGFADHLRIGVGTSRGYRLLLDAFTRAAK